MVAQLELEKVEGISPHVLEEETLQAVVANVIRPHQPERISPQKPAAICS